MDIRLPEVILWTSSQSSMVENPIVSARTLHIEIDRHYIREFMENRSIKVWYIPTQAQTVDIFTKSLPRDAFLQH